MRSTGTWFDISSWNMNTSRNSSLVPWLLQTLFRFLLSRALRLSKKARTPRGTVSPRGFLQINAHMDVIWGICSSIVCPKIWACKVPLWYLQSKDRWGLYWFFSNTCNKLFCIEELLVLKRYQCREWRLPTVHQGWRLRWWIRQIFEPTHEKGDCRRASYKERGQTPCLEYALLEWMRSTKKGLELASRTRNESYLTREEYIDNR